MTQQLIGRQREQALLEACGHSGRAEFVAIYGRRRVGKTFMVRTYYHNTFAFDVTGVLDGSKAEQMESFHTALLEHGYKGKKCTSWIEAFFALRRLLEAKIKAGERCVIFIDELPCFDTPKAGFVNALGHFWNSWANWQPEVMLIVCGSATSWMVRNVIDNHGGLHDRITHEIHLHPFTLAEAEQFFAAGKFVWNRLSVLQAYMAVGGVPYYLGLFMPTDSPATGLDRLFFGPNAPLQREYRRLFASLFRQPQPYLDIIGILARHPSGMTRPELSKALHTANNNRLGTMLTDLVYCDFLSCSNVRERKEVKQNAAIYQLVDFYTIFYHTFTAKHVTDGHYWTRHAGEPEVNAWCGLAYERICKSHMPQIKQALGIASVATQHYSWRGTGSNGKAQIDIIIDRADSTINLCEVKYCEGEYSLGKEEFLKIKNRISTFRESTGTHKTIVPTMITTFGLRPGAYSDQIVVRLEMDDLFG